MKWYGKIGFASEEKVRPGVVKNVIVEKSYFGDMIRDTRRWQGASNQVNDNINIDAQISIVADLYATKNVGYMRWIEYMGIKWKVKSVEPKYPRLIISMGDVYNE